MPQVAESEGILGRKKGTQFLWNETWPLLVLSFLGVCTLFDLDGFPLLLEDVSKDL